MRYLQIHDANGHVDNANARSILRSRAIESEPWRFAVWNVSLISRALRSRITRFMRNSSQGAVAPENSLNGFSLLFFFRRRAQCLLWRVPAFTGKGVTILIYGDKLYQVAYQRERFRHCRMIRHGWWCSAIWSCLIVPNETELPRKRIVQDRWIDSREAFKDFEEIDIVLLAFWRSSSNLSKDLEFSRISERSRLLIQHE